MSGWCVRTGPTSDGSTSTPTRHADWVAFTPDSRQVAIVRQVETTGCPTTICLAWQLDLIDASGKVQTIATADGMDFVQFRPPDGHELLYRARVDGKWGLFAMDLDGANVRPIAPPTVPSEMDMTFASATYSADGGRIFFSMYTGDATATAAASSSS